MKRVRSLLILLIVFGCLLGGFLYHKQITTDEKKSAMPARKKEVPHQDEPDINVMARPKSIPVLVNKQHPLPEAYEPEDLVDANIGFIFSEDSPKRKMRAAAAAAIEELFAGAANDGITLLGVSAYRSRETQEALFQHYVQEDGLEAAKLYSAPPGTSEHETGLAIDVTGGDGRCAAEDCFAGSPEAKWLEDHAAKYGFIIRYPKGKEVITGYQYEPWHLRYVGKEIAEVIAANEITLEEYYRAVPVSK
ncbi:M15 family metallopeptidase [Bacillus rubiinfantis]|uniref:M15 family metallopeptidase n=1 Tax=Bacillus rubiinfantis TaxID=1499680 RepID=UPI000693FFB8|nr:M15 family metallopeptidase [Bacillus rubiinfantis]